MHYRGHDVIRSHPPLTVRKIVLPCNQPFKLSNPISGLSSLSAGLLQSGNGFIVTLSRAPRTSQINQNGITQSDSGMYRQQCRTILILFNLTTQPLLDDFFIRRRFRAIRARRADAA